MSSAKCSAKRVAGGMTRSGGASTSRSGPEMGPDVVAGRRPVLELLRAGQPAERVLIARGGKPSGILAEIRRRATESSVPVRVVSGAELDKVASGLNHQGVAALTERYRYKVYEELLDHSPSTLLFLDGVTDPHNLGSLVRTAHGAAFGGIVIPSHRAAGVTAAARRVSAGASELMAIARVTNLSRALDAAREAGFWIVGLDVRATTDIWSSELTQPPVALVLGSEDRGISRLVQSRCDEMLRIPCSGSVGSLNVAVAGAIAMFEVARKRDLVS